MLSAPPAPRASSALINATFSFSVLRASLPYRVSLRLRLAVSPVDQEEKKSRGLHSKCSKCADDLRLGKQRHLNGVRFGRPAAAGAQRCRCRGRGGHQRHQRWSDDRRLAPPPEKKDTSARKCDFFSCRGRGLAARIRRTDGTTHNSLSGGLDKDAREPLSLQCTWREARASLGGTFRPSGAMSLF